MTPQDNETLWRDRFVAVNLVRIGGTVVVLFALAIWQSDVVVRGGSVLLGVPLVIAGLVASFWGPIWLARRWKRQDGR